MKKMQRMSGMTLIEVLVALLLLSLLSTGILTAFRIGQKSYDQVLRVDRGEWRSVVTQRFVRQILESAYPFEPDVGAQALGLEGGSDRLKVSAPATQGLGATGLERFEFVNVRRPDGLFDLRVFVRPDRNGRGEAGRVDEGDHDGETLIERARSVRWSYFDAGDAGRWLDEWGEQRLPALIRLSVAFPEGDSRQWPDLVAATRVTNDANCEYDFVKQDCREVGE
jgi:prepilin-type N-terminal cleavage/methylation domain-containing protein